MNTPRMRDIRYRGAFKHVQEVFPKHLAQLRHALFAGDEAHGLDIGKGIQRGLVAFRRGLGHLFVEEDLHLHVLLEPAGDAAGVYGEKGGQADQQQHQSDA